jgi:UDP-N-acetylmuramoyl-tripeptide--D-alanyl-D-alanine ligase
VLFRSALGSVCFIGITGSCGKTTTTELIAAILSRKGRVRKGSHENTIQYFPKTILGVRPWHSFCVSEVSGGEPGVMDEAARLLRPHIAVVTHVGQDHYSSFRTLESVAAEKGKLVEAIPAQGTVVLNADDPHVYAMRRRTAARVITYGQSAEAMVRAENVSCAWPQRLSLDVCYLEQRSRVSTRLLGEHWTSTVLAALCAGLAAGVPLESAVDAVEAFDPVPYRMSPHRTADGVTFISDTWKAPLWTVPASLDFMRKAQADRKIIVIGSISDTPKSFHDRHKVILQQALGVADRIAFVGEHAHSVLRARSAQDDRVVAFSTLRELDAYLGDYLKPGDLVLLKGTGNDDHLQRIELSRNGGVACCREKCGKRRFCVDCRLLQSPGGPERGCP